MAFFGPVHIGFLIGTILFLAMTMYIVSRVSFKWQNRMFSFAAIMCCLNLFFRFAMQNSFSKGLRIDLLVRSWLQVCNFNFILLPLMLIKRNNIARQYSILFAMASAVSGIIGCEFDCDWFDPEVMSYWYYHLFAIALPLWMLAARRLKPEKKYVLKTSFCVFLYFTIVAVILTILIRLGKLPEDTGYSFIYNTSGVKIFEFFYSLIPVPYFYLYLVLPLVTILFYIVAWLFRNYEVVEYDKYFERDEEFKKKHPGIKKYFTSKSKEEENINTQQETVVVDNET